MKIIPLLILWSLPRLSAGEHGQSLPCVRKEARHAEVHVDPAVIQQAGNDSSPGDSSSRSLSGSLGDEEDSLEDVFLDADLSLTRSMRNRGRDALSSFLHGHHDCRRTLSLAHTWLTRHGFHPRNTTSGIPRIMLVDESDRLAAARMLINAAENGDPNGFPGLWDRSSHPYPPRSRTLRTVFPNRVSRVARSSAGTLWISVRSKGQVNITVALTRTDSFRRIGESPLGAQ